MTAFSLTPYLAEALARHVFATVHDPSPTYTPPAVMYLGLLDITGAELTSVTSTGYARQVLPAMTPVLETDGFVFVGGAPVTFTSGPDAGGGFPNPIEGGNVAWVYLGVGVFDASTGGNRLFELRFPYPRYVPFSSKVTFPTGEIEVGFEFTAWEA